MARWQVGQEFTDPGGNVWSVQRVTERSTTMLPDEFHKVRSARGTVVLYCQALDWEIVAPAGGTRLKHLKPVLER